MDKSFVGRRKNTVWLFIEEEQEEFEKYLRGKIVELGGEPIKAKSVFNNLGLTIIYTSKINDFINELIHRGFHEIFWKKNFGEEDNNIIIGFDSKRYIVGIYGSLYVLKDTLDEKLREILEVVKLTNKSKYLDKIDKDYLLWSKIL